MFTGIITHQATIVAIDGWSFTIVSPFETLPTVWQSIAHDGACMTVNAVDTENSRYSFFAMNESLRKTNFSNKSLWDQFNIELCLQAGQRLDGHFVTWHIDTTGTVKTIEPDHDGSTHVHIEYKKSWGPYVIPKWSIAINGVSLTVVEANPWHLSVWLIPLTQEATNLWTLTPWDAVNLEFDMLGKYVLKSQWIEISS
jgi:riboflavin synthase